ncbi:MAG: serine/threonine protein kinase, partial [Nostoc sp.]
MNNPEWGSCLREKGIATRTVDDDTLIATRPIPKPQPKLRNVSIPLPEKPEGSTTDAWKSERSQPSDHNANIIEQARQKYESG